METYQHHSLWGFCQNLRGWVYQIFYLSLQNLTEDLHSFHSASKLYLHNQNFVFCMEKMVRCYEPCLSRLWLYKWDTGYITRSVKCWMRLFPSSSAYLEIWEVWEASMGPDEMEHKFHGWRASEAYWIFCAKQASHLHKSLVAGGGAKLLLEVLCHPHLPYTYRIPSVIIFLLILNTSNRMWARDLTCLHLISCNSYA